MSNKNNGMPGKITVKQSGHCLTELSHIKVGWKSCIFCSLTPPFCWRRRSQLIGAPAVKNTWRTTADSLKPAQTTTPHAGAQRKPTAPYRHSRCC